MPITTLVQAAVMTVALHGQLPDVSTPGRSNYDFDAHAGSVFVIHHFGVRPGCDGGFTGPTGAARWYNQMVEDYKVDGSSRLQVLDIAAEDQPDFYLWWVAETSPNHPVLADRTSRIVPQLVTDPLDWPNILVIDCHGEVKYSQPWFTTQRVYEEELKPVVNAALAECVG